MWSDGALLKRRCMWPLSAITWVSLKSWLNGCRVMFFRRSFVCGMNVMRARFLPALYAAYLGRTECFQLLQGHDAPTQDENTGETALHIAVANNQLGIVLDPLRNYSADEANKRGDTPFHYAATRCYVHILNAFVAIGADFDKRGSSGETALLKVLKSVSSSDSRLASLEKLDNVFATVKILLGYGTDCTIPDVEGRTALYCAVDAQCSKSFALLLEKGANVHARTRAGLSVYDEAVSIISNGYSLRFEHMCYMLLVLLKAKAQRGAALPSADPKHPLTCALRLARDVHFYLRACGLALTVENVTSAIQSIKRTIKAVWTKDAASLSQEAKYTVSFMADAGGPRDISWLASEPEASVYEML